MTIATIAPAKLRARRLREDLAERGERLSHGQALERVAREQDARDWNTLRARLGRDAPQAIEIADLRAGDRVEGHYIQQAFTGTLLRIAPMGGRFRVSIQLDRPIDVVTFASFSNLRRRVHGLVDRHGRSSECNSRGPHLIVDRRTMAADPPDRSPDGQPPPVRPPAGP